MKLVQVISKRTVSPSLKLSQTDFSIPKILGDSNCVAILMTLKEIPKSVVEIQQETRIPISTIYRRVKILHDLKFLKISGSITSDGNKNFLYKSKIKSIDAKLDGDLKIKIEFV